MDALRVPKNHVQVAERHRVCGPSVCVIALAKQEVRQEIHPDRRWTPPLLRVLPVVVAVATVGVNLKQAV